jgi:hypothetical protein
VHLLRRDIVYQDDENGLVGFKQVLELVEVTSLIAGFAPHGRQSEMIHRDQGIFQAIGLGRESGTPVILVLMWREASLSLCENCLTMFAAV